MAPFIATVLLGLIFVTEGDKIFSLLPADQYVPINKTATFKCATDNPDYTVYFYVPIVSNVHIDNVPLPGGGDEVIAMFKATKDLDGTNLTCCAVDNNLNLHGVATARLHVIGVFSLLPQSIHAKINETVTLECATNVTGYNIAFSIPGIIAFIHNKPLPRGGQRAVANIIVSTDINGTDIKCGALDGFDLIDITKAVHINIRGSGVINRKKQANYQSQPFLMRQPINGLLSSSQLHSAAIDSFITKPTTQYVWINQTATFKCATNVTGYIIGFRIVPNDIEAPMQSDTLPGGGEKANITIKGALSANGTSVTCGILDSDNNFTIIATSNTVYLFNEGSPTIQKFIAVKTIECGIDFSWNAPYLLPGLSVSYKVYINGTLQNKVSTTSHTYYPNATSSTVYNISVAAYNESVGDGKIIETMVHFYINTTVEIIYDKIQRRANKWIHQFTIPSDGICISGSTFIVKSCSRKNKKCYSASTEYNNVTVNPDMTKDTLIINSNMTLPKDELFNTSITIIDSKRPEIITDVVETSTYNLQHISVIYAGIGILCLDFTIVDGVSTYDIYVTLIESTNKKHIVKNYTSSNYKFTDCIHSNDISPNSKWHLQGCDGPIGNDEMCKNPAIDIFINVNSTSSASTSTVAPSPSTTPTPTSALVPPLSTVTIILIVIVPILFICTVVLGILVIYLSRDRIRKKICGPENT